MSVRQRTEGFVEKIRRLAQPHGGGKVVDDPIALAGRALELFPV